MRTVILIADVIPEFKNVSIDDKTLECIPNTYFTQIQQALLSFAPNVIHYNSPVDFMNNISKHKNDVVLSIWSGIGSKFRKSIVPAICEAYNICYVGADPYVHSISQDKYLTKIVCERYGLHSAKGILCENEDDLLKISELKFPIVVKPNFEGGSIGISEKSLHYTIDEAKKMIAHLLTRFKLPVLAEEYIEGYELSTSIIGTRSRIDICETTQLIINEVEYFYNQIYSYEPKVENPKCRSKKIATNLLPENIMNIFKKIFLTLGKTELLRIDGRLDKNGEYRLIELSPDAYLGKRGTTTLCAKSVGYPYEKMLELLIKNAIEDYNKVG